MAGAIDEHRRPPIQEAVQGQDKKVPFDEHEAEFSDSVEFDAFYQAADTTLRPGERRGYGER